MSNGEGMASGSLESDLNNPDVSGLGRLSLESVEVEDVQAPEPLEIAMLRLGELAVEVFDIHLIREKILNFAIHEANGKGILGGTVSSLRLVQKSWLKTIAALFHKNGDPLYQFVLDENNSLNGSSYVEQNGKLLNQFVDSVTNPFSSIHDFIPTFSLNIKPPFFRQENRDSLFDSLRLCGIQLLEINMKVPVNCGSMPGMFPGSVQLNRMKKLTVDYARTNLANMGNEESVIAHDSNAAFLTQFILLGATGLTEFEVPFNIGSTSTPSGFQFLALPLTLTKISLSCKMVTAQMELLAKCHLPHLQELKFLIADFEYDSEVFFRIFNNFRHSLRSTLIEGLLSMGPLQNTHMYRFPVMENLKCFRTYSIHSGIGANQVALETCFPKLRSMSLKNQTVAVFQNWTDNSTLSAVKELDVSLVNRNFHYRDKENYIHNWDLELMQRLHMTFPNVTYLELTASATVTRTCGFKYMFMEMKQIKTLVLNVEGSSSVVGSDVFWDAVLIGATFELAACLKASPDLWENVELKNDVMPSIRMLEELKCLKLLDKLGQPVPDDTSKLLISDMAFYYALLKMEKLTKLYFQGRFLASEKMTEKWEDCGKTLVYLPPPYIN